VRNIYLFKMSLPLNPPVDSLVSWTFVSQMAKVSL
jgi:hypothetical protein